MSSSDEDDEVSGDFRELVNMTPGELKKWLGSEESKSVGVTGDGRKKSGNDGKESVGHDSGRRIVAILETKKDDLKENDFAHMRKVNGYIRRHLAQRPKQERIDDSRWRYSLMNWGHDPLKS
ncbi:MAG TPA: DUF3140 domain-containing protein [Frankiaceae bacterium]|jgi:hypothetical protein|nr:DUF3140 domain-containing protein [Frankiaceae bacterium]